MIIKYNVEGKVEWARVIGGSSRDFITSVAVSADGGYIVGGWFSSRTIELENGITLTNKGDDDGMIIKYSAEGKAEWAKAIGGNKDDSITSIAASSDGGYIVGGHFSSSTVELDNGIT